MKIDYMQGDDWAGLYVEGRLYYQGHSIPERIWLELLMIMGAEVDENNEGWIYDLLDAEGGFPMDSSEAYSHKPAEQECGV